jgi:hypothetical protein
MQKLGVKSVRRTLVCTKKRKLIVQATVESMYEIKSRSKDHDVYIQIVYSPVASPQPHTHTDILYTVDAL